MDRGKLEQYFGKGIHVDKVCKMLVPIPHAEQEILLLSKVKSSLALMESNTNYPSGVKFASKMMLEVDGAIASFTNDVWIGLPTVNFRLPNVIFRKQIGHFNEKGKVISGVDQYLNRQKIINFSMINGRSEPDDTVLFSPQRGDKGKVVAHGNEITAILFLWLKWRKTLPTVTTTSEFCHIVKDVLCLDIETVVDYLKFHKVTSLKSKKAPFK